MRSRAPRASNLFQTNFVPTPCRQCRALSSLKHNSTPPLFRHPRPTQPMANSSTSLRRPFTTTRHQASTSNATSATDPHTTAPHPPRETHYSFFPNALPRGPPPNGSFAIDLPALKREYLQLQAAAHPDRHAGASKARAEALSARINEAYRALVEPLPRAQYLLLLAGEDVVGDEAAREEDAELLGTVLDAREEIEEAEKEEDLVGLGRDNERRIAESERILAQAFEEGDLAVARMEAVRLRYWINIRDSVKGWEKGKPLVLVH